MCPDGASTLAVLHALAGAVEFLAGLSLLFTEPGMSLLLSLQSCPGNLQTKMVKAILPATDCS